VMRGRGGAGSRRGPTGGIGDCGSISARVFLTSFLPAAVRPPPPSSRASPSPRGKAGKASEPISSAFPRASPSVRACSSNRSRVFVCSSSFGAVVPTSASPRRRRRRRCHHHHHHHHHHFHITTTSLPLPLAPPGGRESPANGAVRPIGARYRSRGWGVRSPRESVHEPKNFLVSI
jgi:hypothetical protein